MTLKKAFGGLPKNHQNALQWFVVNSGLTKPWPAPLPDGTLLTTKAKGIYKPHWSKYALSVCTAPDFLDTCLMILTPRFVDKPAAFRWRGERGYWYAG
ncbi:MAG: hypothetical protein EXR67_03450 [Dehalococcoidia bacterium]|nr:hypothetical protein [Dehalococcoidia bacterium]